MKAVRACRRSVVLALLLVACTPLGFTRGDYWTGTSTGTIGPCPAFEFEISMADDAISGSATSEFEWGNTLWDVRGQVADGNRVSLETVSKDPRVTRQRLTWTGSYNPVLWTLTQEAEADCPERTVRLQRR